MGALTPVRPVLRPIHAFALYRMNSGTYTNRSPRFTRVAFLTIPSPIIRRVLSPLCHATPQLDRFPLLRGPGFTFGMQARHLRQTESSSSSYGLVVRLLLLSTSPRGDAVAIGYGPESVCPKGTFTPLTIALFGRTSHQRSWWIVQTRPTTKGPASSSSCKFESSTLAPPRGREAARELMPAEQEMRRCRGRLRMNNPPTAVGGIAKGSSSDTVSQMVGFNARAAFSLVGHV